MQAEEDRLFTEFQRTHDPRLLAAVFDLTAYEVLRVALHLSRDVPSAEDLVQATFLAAIEGASRWRPDRPLMPWLLGILTNQARAARKRERRRYRLGTGAAAGEPDQVPDAAPDASRAAAANELRGALANALAGLPAPYREVVDLRLERGWSTTRVALALRRPPGTVRAQLYRAYEILRSALPRGHGAPLLAVLDARGLEALRANVLATLPAAAAAGGALAWTGGGLLMAKKLWVGAALVVAAGSGWVVWTEASRAKAPDAAPLEAAAPAEAAKHPLGTAPLERSALPAVAASLPASVAPAEPAPAAEVEAARVPPWEVRLRVLDAGGNGVPGARLDVRAARRVPADRGGIGIQVRADEFDYVTPSASAPACASASTEADGRCVLVLDREACYAAVSKPGAGHALEKLTRPERPEAERVIRLRPWLVVEGTVLRSVGIPAAGARVAAAPVQPAQLVPGTEPATADESGHFSLELGDGRFSVAATSGPKRSHAVEVVTAAGRRADPVRLYFPGSLPVHGVLLDPTGRPCAGTVLAIARRGVESRAEAGADGTFSLDLPKTGAWDLLGMAPGHANSDLARVEVAEGEPARSQLRLAAPAAVRGTVLDAEQRPIAGAVVRLEPAGVTESESAFRFGTVAPAQSAADGTFELGLVHPAAAWTLACAPDPRRPRVCVRVADVRGGQNVRVVVGGDALRVARIRGRVVDPSGAPVRSFTMRVDTALDGGPPRSPKVDVGKPETITDPRGAFEVDGLAFGKTYTLLFEAKGLASAALGPWTVDAAERNETVRMTGFGSLVVRVVDADGQPVAGAGCRMTSEDPRLRVMLNVGGDGQGVVRIAKVTPARYVIAALARGGQELVRQEVVVAPGPATEVELRVPKK